MALQSVINQRTQKGAALLALLMIFIVAASYSLVKKLNANTIDHLRRASSLSALNEAKAALIGYAIRFPEIDAETGTDPIDGPGYLPCPDINNDGSAGASCALIPNGTTVGRIPWKTLELSELRDAAGQTLWYAVSDNYKNNPKALPELNSDTAGNFFVDGNGDIVAILFAAGEPVAAQDRANDPLDVTNYLEDDNADVNDNFVTRPTLNPDNEFNDTVVTITRQELMSAVEKRVLGDVDEVLTNYQTNYNAFPWLSAFVNPAVSRFRGDIGTRQGHLPFHWSADPDSVALGRSPFTTDPAKTNGSSVAWNITTNDSAPVRNGTVTADCLNNVDCNDGLFPQIAELPITTTFDCTWSNKETVDCPLIVSSTTRAISYFINFGNFCLFGTTTRTYTIDFPVFSGVFSKNDPTSTTIRSRNVAITNQALTDQAGAINITDTTVGLGPTCTINDGTGSLSLVNAIGTLVVNGIHYDLDVDDGELPTWFVENGWHELIYVAYASGEALPGDTTAGQDCVTLGSTCITVNINGTANTNVRAVVLSAGAIVTPSDSGINQDRVTTPDATDYFDNPENTNSDDTFLKSRTTATYNDQTRIISTAP